MMARDGTVSPKCNCLKSVPVHVATGCSSCRAGHQQQRCAGNLPYKANKYVESWGTNREHIELTYKFDTDNLWTVAKWVVAFPTLVYMITKAEFHKSDRKFGRKEREFM